MEGEREGERKKVDAIIDQGAGKHVLTCVPTVLVVMLDCSLSLSLSDIIIVKDIYFDAIRNHTATSSTHVLSLTIKTGCDISSFGCYISVISYPLSIYLYSLLLS